MFTHFQRMLVLTHRGGKKKEQNKKPTLVIVLTVIILCFSPTGRCSSGKCYMEEQDLRGNAAGLHKARLGPSQVGKRFASGFALLYFQPLSPPVPVKKQYRD